MVAARNVLYVAHPLSPTEAEMADAGRSISTLPTITVAINRNVERAMRWLAWLRRAFPETTFIAPWIATVMSLYGDDSPALREAGLVDDCAVVERCDGIVLCGGRISSGMYREACAGRFPAHWICDLTGLGGEPPGSVPVPATTFAAYVDAMRREAGR